MSNKLSDWLPILQHPEVGERICEAAGLKIDGWFGSEFRVFDRDSMLPKFHVIPEQDMPPLLHAALASGTLAVLTGDDGEGWLVCFDLDDEHGNGVWTVMDYEGYERGYGPTLPAAVLAAAKRVWVAE